MDAGPIFCIIIAVQACHLLEGFWLKFHTCASIKGKCLPSSANIGLSKQGLQGFLAIQSKVASAFLQGSNILCQRYTQGLEIDVQLIIIKVIYLWEGWFPFALWQIWCLNLHTALSSANYYWPAILPFNLLDSCFPA